MLTATSRRQGAMGAAQWTGRFRTRPHALLDVRDFNNVDEWVKTLPRGCKRTLKKVRRKGVGRGGEEESGRCARER